MGSRSATLLAMMWLMPARPALSTPFGAQTCDASTLAVDGDACETADHSGNGIPSRPMHHREEQQRLIEWLNGHPDGYFNPKQQVRGKLKKRKIQQRHVVDGTAHGEGREEEDPRYSSYFSGGVFAREDIAQGEILLQVPWELVIGFDGEDDDDDDFGNSDGEEESYGTAESTQSTSSIHCGTVRTLARLLSRHHERQRQEEEDRKLPLDGETTTTPLATYLQHLIETRNHHSLPVAWSDAGQQLLLQVFGGANYRSLLVDDAFDLLDNLCGVPRGGSGGTAGVETEEFTMEEVAAMLIQQRAVSHADEAGDIPIPTWMVPLYDLYGHTAMDPPS
jgi:hypothetical protein